MHVTFSIMMHVKHFLYVDMHVFVCWHWTCQCAFYIDMHVQVEISRISSAWWHAFSWHSFFGSLTCTFYWHAWSNFECMLTCILQYVDMCCRIKTHVSIQENHLKIRANCKRADAMSSLTRLSNPRRRHRRLLLPTIATRRGRRRCAANTGARRCLRHAGILMHVIM